MRSSSAAPRPAPALAWVLVALVALGGAWSAVRAEGSGLQRPGSGEGQEVPGRWWDREGRLLPFRTDGDVERFLREAPLGRSKVITGGINRPVRYDLELEGFDVRAIFRTVEVEDVEMSTGRRNPLGALRDSWTHEIAAWKLSRLLGLDHVPPAVERRIGGVSGSLQLWIEQARSEADRIRAQERPAFPARWSLGRQALAVFDNLIHNFDRNPGNLLLDERGKLWFVDHTRSFPMRPDLVDADRLRTCPRKLHRRLRELDEEGLEAALGAWLDPVGRSALLARRDRILERFDDLIAERGESAVLRD